MSYRCAMDTRFNSYYHEELHPFVEAMTDFLQESGRRARRPAFMNYFYRSAQQKYDTDISMMVDVAKEVVMERKMNPNDKKDLLNAMIKGRDPKTGEGLTDDSIINNMITFLIAGHETTSGMLSFLFYNLLKNPSAYQAAQREVDAVVGRGPVTVDHMSKLPYIEACLRETLRLTPTAPAFSVKLREDGPDAVILGGKWEVRKGQPITCLLPKLHRDPLVYGADAELFKPERMLDEPFSKLPPNSWKPFGNGMRGCIGRPFAWQESILTVAMLLQTFNFRMDEPSYTLKIKQTLTIKPKEFYMHATLREHIDSVHLEKALHMDPSAVGHPTKKDLKIEATAAGSPKKPMTILYGSNAGTCESLAQSLARNASGRGYQANVETLDSAVDKIPKNQPIILLSSSYEGQPPDNAAHFFEWINNLKDKSKFKGVKYAVYGCGNHDWVSTFHRVPKMIDVGFEANGATKVTEIGLGDVGAGDVFNDFDKWQDEKLWPALGSSEETSEESGLEIDIDTESRRSRLRQDVKEAVVVSNEILTAESEPEKRHIVLELPTGMTYTAGDYLAVLPLNDTKMIRRVLKWAHLPWDTVVTIKTGANTTLPTGQPISLMDLLGAYVELGQPATRKNVTKIAASCTDEIVKEKILALAGVDFEKEILEKRRSPLDILEDYPNAALPLSEYLAMLPPMRIRQYSISSSPLHNPSICTITWSVLDNPALSAAVKGNSRRFLGVASNYLSHVEAGDRIHVAVKPSHGMFHPPADVENTPVMMFCAGTGIAPFRGFIQERVIQIRSGRKLAPAYLFVGCSHPDTDTLFKTELQQWEKEGAVKIFYAWSKASELSKGCKHVQDRLWAEREEMVEVFNQGAKLYVCGSARVGEGVTEVTKKIYKDSALKKGKEVSDEFVQKWFESIKSDRFASDVFA